MRCLMLLNMMIFSLAAGSAQADFYRYETEEGTLSFADQLKQIPERYQEEAETVKPASLWDYPRMTIAKAPAPVRREPVVAPPSKNTRVSKPATGTKLTVEAVPGLLVDIDTDSEHPVMIERNRFYWTDGKYLPHTIVTQGDKTLAIVRQR